MSPPEVLENGGQSSCEASAALTVSEDYVSVISAYNMMS